MSDLQQYVNIPPPSVSQAGWLGVLELLESAPAVGVEVTPELVLLISNCLINYERFKTEEIGSR